HRRLHRHGRGRHAPPAGLAGSCGAAALRAAAARRIRAPGATLAAARSGIGPMKLPGATARVLLALAAGAIVGLALAQASAAGAATAAAIGQPIGKLWLSALQMTVVPLVLALVILGVANAANAAASGRVARRARSEEHTSELQSRENLVCRLLLEKKKQK